MTNANAGSGTFVFAKRDRFWVPTEASARATIGNIAATERIAFAAYRFPVSLPPSSFSVHKSRESDSLDSRLLY